MDLFLELSSAEDSNESPRCSLDRNIAGILDLLDSDDDDRVPDTQPIISQILEGVVAYVEARSGNDNRSSAISRELEVMGASVESKLTNDVTHVIFKAGRKVTQERAKKLGVHLVTVLWVDSCKQNLRRMSELLFPVVPIQTLRTPVIVGRLKKCKSMQPKDFDDEVASSADRGQKRRRRRAHADKWKVLETPGAGLLLQGAAHAYVEETQPRSPTDASPLLPFSLIIPDTPPSMREKLDSLRRKRLSILHSAECERTTPSCAAEVNEPLQRRLFGAPEDNASPQPCVATPETVFIEDNKTATTKTTSGAVEAEEEDPLPPVCLLGSKTVCVTNRRHRLLPLNQEPSTELLQPIYTDQSRRPGQTHCFPEIASLMPRNTKRTYAKKRKETTSNDDNDGVNLSAGKKCGGKNAGKRKSGSLGRSKSPREGRGSKRRKKDSVGGSECDVDVACLKETTQVRSAVTSIAASSLSRQKTLHETECELKEHGKVVDVNDNDVGDASGLRSKAVQSCSRTATANKGCPDVQVGDLSLQTHHVDTDRSRGDRNERASSGGRTSGTHVGGSEGCGDKRVTKRLSVNLGSSAIEARKASARQTETKRRSATRGSSITIDAQCVSRVRRRESSASEPRPSNVVGKEGAVSRRRSVRLQCTELHKSDCNISNDARQSHGRTNRQTNDLSVSNLSDVNQSTATQVSLTSSMLQRSQLLNLTATSRKSIDEFAVGSAHRHRIAAKILNRKTPRAADTSGNNSSVGNVSRTESVSVNCSRNNRSDVERPSTSRQSGLSVEHASTSRQSGLSVERPSTSRKSGLSVEHASTSRQSGLSVERPSTSRKSGLSVERPSTSQKSGLSVERPSTSRKSGLSVEHASTSRQSGLSVERPSTSRKSGSSSCDRRNSNVCDTSHWKKVMISENRKSHDLPCKTLVMTSLHTDEQDVVKSVVKKLGRYRLVTNVCDTTTHVICGNDRRTLNVLLGICRGSWLLSLEWVFKSLECNRWLDEEPYEQSDFFPAAQISRLERVTATVSYTQDLFSRHSPVCVAPSTVPRRSDLVKLIKLCAGQVTQCVTKCRVYVGKVLQQPDIVCVSEQWILDSITAHRALPYKAYRLNSVRSDSSPEY